MSHAHAHAHVHAHVHVMCMSHVQVSKDLCRLSSELPFDLDECELAIEEDSSGGGVDLKKLVQVRAWCMACGVCGVVCAWHEHGVVCAWRGVCMVHGVVYGLADVFMCAWHMHGVRVVCAWRALEVRAPPPS